MPIDHAKLPIRDLDRSRAFYQVALAPLGWKLVWDQTPTLGFGTGDGGEDNEPIAFELIDPPLAHCHIAFTAASRQQVDDFCAAAVAAGGTSNGPPGDRPYGTRYYAAFVLDPDGHNLEAVCKGA